MRLLPPTRSTARLSRSAALRPRLACEITPAGVAAGHMKKNGADMVAAFSALPAGSIAPGLREVNLLQPAPVAAALGRALEEVAERDTTLTLVIPDAAVRVLILDFDSLPAKSSEALPIVRFRLRKLVPFDAESAAVSYQVISAEEGTVRVVAAITPAAVLKEYEDAAREAGYEPGAVLPSTLAALASVEDSSPALIVNRNGNSVTTAITSQNDLLLHRTVELARSSAAEPAAAREEADRQISAAAAPLLAHARAGTEAVNSGFDWEPAGKGTGMALENAPAAAAMGGGRANAISTAITPIGLEDANTSGLVLRDPRERMEELRNIVSVTIAYFEDTLGSPPDVLWASGPGGAAELDRLLGGSRIPVRDLFSVETGAATSIPHGMLAGVRGALAG